MNYLALGDSISIDDYTGVDGGGAVAQFAKLVGARDVQDLTFDGCTTVGVIERLRHVTIRPDVITLTAGGNDLLEAAPGLVSGATASTAMRPIIDNLRAIGDWLATQKCVAIVSTIYDPTDGDDSLSTQLGLPLATRVAHVALNEEIRTIVRKRGFVLSDLEALFRGHGIRAAETWITLDIEPNLAGATAIARHWHDLYRRAAKVSRPGPA
ncbi:MAG: SGNH/GDSL hydrolase family protein [Planctomycetes bacterium]|nr:SGNH/GDSL hydrolase family protein [Planctomycetota bacterium]MBI3844376.1 SGNH/GDSL hydrolase family protein [Planctomycetota bacterium]